MKKILNLVAVALAGGLSLTCLDARAVLEVSASVGIRAEADFYVPLEPHGAWITVGSYGRCWRPAGVAVTWRPYCDGHWEWTDCGWYWVSGEPWAWACYHYGRWVYDPTYAWVWVPAIEWAPSWVEWRIGGGYIGWAPLSPVGVVLAVGAPQFVFVQAGRFHDPVRPSNVIVNNSTIINNTTVINNVRRETRTIEGGGPQTVFVNEGPGVETVQKATGKKFNTVPVRQAVNETPVPPEVSRGKGGPKRETTPTPTVAPQQPQAAPERKVTPSESVAPQLPKATPERKAPPSEKIGPPAKSSPAEGKRPEKQKPTFAPLEPSQTTPGSSVSPSPAPGQHRNSAPDYKSPPTENRAKPAEPSAPGKGKPAPKRKLVPAPEQPSPPVEPHEESPVSPKGKGEDKEHGKDEKEHGKGK